MELFRAAWSSDAATPLLVALIAATGFLFIAMLRFWEGLRTRPAPNDPSVVPPAVLAAMTVGLALLAAPLGALVLGLSSEILEGGGP